MGVVADVVLALRRNAITDPPDGDGFFVTDQGLGRYGGPRWLPRDSGHGVAWWRLDGEQLWPSPSWWFDVRPSDGEPLTINDLHNLLSFALGSPLLASVTFGGEHGSIARLRAALNAITRKPAA